MAARCVLHTSIGAKTDGYQTCSLRLFDSLKAGAMNTQYISKRWRYLGVLVLCIVCAGVGYAQANGTFAVVWSTLFGGGTSSGGSYAVQGVAGQAAVGLMQGGVYAVQSGFQSGALGLPTAVDATPTVADATPTALPTLTATSGLTMTATTTTTPPVPSPTSPTVTTTPSAPSPTLLTLTSTAEVTIVATGTPSAGSSSTPAELDVLDNQVFLPLIQR